METFDESRVSLSFSNSYVTCQSERIFERYVMTHAAVMTNVEGTTVEVVNIELGQICFYRRAFLEHDEHSGRGQESSGKVRALQYQ